MSRIKRWRHERREVYDRRLTRRPSPLSRAWRIAIAAALVMAAAGVLLSAVLFARSTQEVDKAARAAEIARQVAADKIVRKGIDATVRACKRGNKIRRDLARQHRRNAREHRALRVFILETRRARADRRGTSYDGRFVHIIDKFVLPAFAKTTYRTFPLLDCAATTSAGHDVPLPPRPKRK